MGAAPDARRARSVLARQSTTTAKRGLSTPALVFTPTTLLDSTDRGLLFEPPQVETDVIEFVVVSVAEPWLDPEKVSEVALVLLGAVVDGHDPVKVEPRPLELAKVLQLHSLHRLEVLARGAAFDRPDERELAMVVEHFANNGVGVHRPGRGPHANVVSVQTFCNKFARIWSNYARIRT